MFIVDDCSSSVNDDDDDVVAAAAAGERMIVGWVTYLRTLELIPSAPINKDVVILVPSLNRSNTLGSSTILLLLSVTSSTSPSPVVVVVVVVEQPTDATNSNRLPK